MSRCIILKEDQDKIKALIRENTTYYALDLEHNRMLFTIVDTSYISEKEIIKKIMELKLKNIKKIYFTNHGNFHGRNLFVEFNY